MTTLNFRRRYHLYLTNTKDNRPGAGPYDLRLPDSPTFRGTLRQILAEIEEFRRLSGGCFISAVIVDPETDTRVSLYDVESAIFDHDWDRRESRRRGHR